MCGVFGFVDRSGCGPSIKLLRRIAVDTESRGRHAFGLAWIDASGGLHCWRRQGAASDRLRDLDRVAGARLVIGHCRWATHGDPADNRNNHPHRSGTGWLVHNGVVLNHESLALRHRLRLASECDSEVLARMVVMGSGPLRSRAARAVDQVEGPLVALGIWRRPDRLLMVRRGNPLSIAAGPGGDYLASRPDALPGRPYEVREGYAIVVGPGESDGQHGVSALAAAEAPSRCRPVDPSGRPVVRGAKPRWGGRLVSRSVELWQNAGADPECC